MRRLCFAGLLVWALIGCSKPPEPFILTDITGAPFAQGFNLLDQNRQPRTLKDYQGKVVWLFFGYTHCPDVCPTTMSQLALAQKKLGADAAKTQVLFVGLDPERDTPELLAQYVPAFNPAFVGLYGDKANIEKTTKDFKVFYQKNAGTDPKYYTLDHSASVFVFDTQGKPRLFYTPAHTIDALVTDTRRLLSE